MCKYIILVLLLASGCGNNHKSNALISDYVRKNTNDPGSYESISFVNNRPLTFGDVYAGKPDSHKIGGALIEHTYRAKNELGALVIQTESFVVDSTEKRVQLLTAMQSKLAADTKEMVNKDIKRLQYETDSIKALY